MTLIVLDAPVPLEELADRDIDPGRPLEEFVVREVQVLPRVCCPERCRTPGTHQYHGVVLVDVGIVQRFGRVQHGAGAVGDDDALGGYQTTLVHDRLAGLICHIEAVDALQLSMMDADVWCRDTEQMLRRHRRANEELFRIHGIILVDSAAGRKQRNRDKLFPCHSATPNSRLSKKRKPSRVRDGLIRNRSGSSRIPGLSSCERGRHLCAPQNTVRRRRRQAKQFRTWKGTPEKMTCSRGGLR